MSANSLPQALRKAKLESLTQEQLDMITTDLVRSIGSFAADPYEAVSEAYLIALEKWDRRKLLIPFVYGCARLNAFGAKRKQWREKLLGDFDLDQFGDSVVDSIACEDKSPYDAFLTPEFANRVNEILAEFDEGARKNNFPGLKNPVVARYRKRMIYKAASAVLKVYHASAIQGKGIGVDEYEDDSILSKQLQRGGHMSGKKAHYAVPARTALNKRLAQELKVSYTTARAAREILKVAARQAIHEGWL